MGSIDGLPWPEDTDAPDGPAQFQALAEATDLRLDNLNTTLTGTDTTIQTAITNLTTRLTAVETSLAALTTDHNTLETNFNNLVAWTKIMLYRVEFRTKVLTANSNGTAQQTFAHPFKTGTVPGVLLCSGSPSGMAAASGAGWATAGPPGPFIVDSPGPSNTKFFVGGYNKSSNFRIYYIAIGEAAFDDRPATSGGPGWDVHINI